MRTINAADGVTCPGRMVDSRDVDVPIREGNSALLSPDRKTAARISAATWVRSSDSRR
jgi:hypothetical protein